MSDTVPTIELDPEDVAGWADQPFESLFALSAADAAGPQLEALSQQFDRLRHACVGAGRAGVTPGSRPDRELSRSAAPLLFDHRVYKSYPISLIEKRQFDRMTTWLQRLTTHDLGAIPLDGVRSVDDWLDRLDEHGMIMLHSTGTTGKLSFFPRSRDEWPGWQSAFFESITGRAPESIAAPRRSRPSIPGTARGTRPARRCRGCSARRPPGARQGRHCPLRLRDLLRPAVAGGAAAQTAEERGELDKLDIDPQLLEERAKLIEAGRNRDQDLERWFTKLAEEYRGQRVRINGVTADLIQLGAQGSRAGSQVRVRARFGAVHGRRA